VAGRLASGDELYFIFSEGVEKIKYEAPLILLKTNFIFQDNVRCEMHRSMRRVAKAIRGEMSQYERDRYDNLDMGEHGEGM